MHFFYKTYFLLLIVYLILRIICFATLGEKMKNKLRKTDFTLNVYIDNFLYIRQGRENK